MRSLNAPLPLAPEHSLFHLSQSVVPLVDRLAGKDGTADSRLDMVEVRFACLVSVSSTLMNIHPPLKGCAISGPEPDLPNCYLLLCFSPLTTT